jgi:hypothetical protein
LILATPHFERASQHVLLAVAHHLDQRALGQISLGRAGLGQRAGFRIRQAGIDHKTGVRHPLQGRNSRFASLVASKGVVETASQEVHLPGRRIPRARREHTDAGG